MGRPCCKVGETYVSPCRSIYEAYEIYHQACLSRQNGVQSIQLRDAITDGLGILIKITIRLLESTLLLPLLWAVSRRYRTVVAADSVVVFLAAVVEAEECL